MDNEQLRGQLEKLHAELHRTEGADEQQRERLQTLASDIQAVLTRQENEPHHYHSLGERLSEAVSETEASHPHITLLMRQAIDSLSYLGI